MKKVTLSLAALAGTMLLASCGTTSGNMIGNAAGSILMGNGTTTTTPSTSTNTDVLGNLLSSLLGSSTTVSKSDLWGTWNYTGTDCVFESENLLAKAGGAVAASKIEEQLNTHLAKVGISKGACSYTFNKDNTYTATIGKRTISGTYTLDSSKKTVKLTYLAGLGSMTAHVAKTGNTLSLLVDSDKLLTLVKGASVLSKGSSTLTTISQLLNNYDGMLVGIQLKK